MRPKSVTVSSQTASAAIPVDYTQANFNLGISVISTGTNTWSVQMTMDNIFDPAVTPSWVPVPSASGLEAGSGGTNEVGSVTCPCRAVRLNVSAYTNGSVTMTVVQGRK